MHKIILTESPSFNCYLKYLRLSQSLLLIFHISREVYQNNERRQNNEAFIVPKCCKHLLHLFYKTAIEVHRRHPPPLGDGLYAVTHGHVS